MASNNPFRIDNITNRTSYNISVSLRNDFGHSAELYSESIHFCHRNIVYSVDCKIMLNFTINLQ